MLAENQPNNWNREPIRIGMIVPSSNVTMEREIPAMLHRREQIAPETFSFHSSRVRMRSVTREELAAMNAQAARACQELADASIEILTYACLVAVMVEGRGAHREAEQKLTSMLAESGCHASVVSSAGALVDTLHAISARRIGVIAPYADDLANQVCDYISAEGVRIEGVRNLSVTNNTAVGRLDPANLLPLARELPSDVDAIVLSACVQMPSLAAIQPVEDQLGIPVISAATATVFQSLRRLGLATTVPNAGRLLSGIYDQPANTEAAQ